MVGNYRPRPRTYTADPVWVKAVVDNIMRQMAVMGPIPIGSRIWMSAMPTVLGQLAAMEDLPMEAIQSMITQAWENTEQAQVDAYQAMNQQLKRAKATGSAEA